MRDLFTSEYLRTTLSVWLLWFGTAFSYYGMVLAQSEILEFHKTCGSGKFTQSIYLSPVDKLQCIYPILLTIIMNEVLLYMSNILIGVVT